MTHSKFTLSSAPLGVLPARFSPQDGGGCAFDPARRRVPLRGTSRSLLSMSFHSIAVQNSSLSLAPQHCALICSMLVILFAYAKR